MNKTAPGILPRNYGEKREMSQKKKYLSFQERLKIYNKHIDFYYFIEDRFSIKSLSSETGIHPTQIRRDIMRYKKILYPSKKNKKETLIEELKELNKRLRELPTNKKYRYINPDIKPLHKEIIHIIYNLISLESFSVKEAKEINKEVKRVLSIKVE